MSRFCQGIRAALVVFAALLAAPVGAAQDKGLPHKSFPSAAAAASALGKAYQQGDPKAIAQILGDKGFRIVSSGDAVIDRHERNWFLSLYKEGNDVVADSKTHAVLNLGRDEQPYPIPIVTHGSAWRFDASEGHEDLLSRRIGKAELTALNMSVAYIQAQRDYQKEDRNGDGVREYAQRIGGSPGKKDGLVWWGKGGKPEGPLAALAEAALAEGYKQAKEGELPVYRGYYYKLLKSQGPGASGGVRDYIVEGKMTRGFALVAFPTRYGISGVLTFMTSHDGVIYQKDLGRDTAAIGRNMVRFDPDKSWAKGQAN